MQRANRSPKFIARGWGCFALTMRKNVIHVAMLEKRGILDLDTLD